MIIDYNRDMKWPVFLLMSIVTSAGAEEATLLSEEKNTIIRQQKIQNETEYEKLRTNWIAPVNLNGTYSHDKSASSGNQSDLKKISASVSQDIFRSGGIAYAIAFANANRKSRDIELQQLIAGLNQQLFTAMLNYRKNSYGLEQSSMRLRNKEIEIFLKRQQYEAGKADITQLNNALMDQSSELKNQASLRYLIAQQRYEIAKISDLNPDKVPIPEFMLIEKDEFMSNRFDLRYAQSQALAANESYGVTKSGYLPTLSFNASAGYQDFDPKETLGGYHGTFYGTGLSLNIPLTYNSSYAIEEAKAIQLKQSASVADKRREVEASYQQSLELIDSYRKYIAITSKNLSLYDELIAATKAGVDAGYKTGYDLQTLQNTKTIDEFEIKINEINIQIELAKIYFSLKPSKDFL